MNVLPVEDARAESSDPPAVLVNIYTGRIREVPCGPGDAAHFSGDRLVYWNKLQNRAEIPTKHASSWKFYKDFCADKSIAQSVGLTVEQSQAYYTAYVSLMKLRGIGAKAKHLQGYTAEQIAAIWHPALLKLRDAHKAARGQARVGDVGALEQITSTLAGASSKAKAK